MKRYDLVVIGGGTAGLVAAHGAAGVGARVLLAERERTGGDCLWTGCVPSKTLIATATLAHRMRHADELGLSPADPEVDLGVVMDRVRDAQATIAPHDSPERLRDAGVEVRQATARFLEPGVIAVGDERVAYRTALIATGSRPAVPPIDGLEEIEVVTTDTIWELRTLPRRLAVLGGGPVGCELAQAFARLGSHVTLVERLPRLLSGEDPEAAELIRVHLVDDGIDVRLDTAAVAARSIDDGGELVIEHDGERDTVPFDRLLVAVGRTPAVEGLGLDAVGVATTGDGHVAVDEHLATTGTRIFAAGDVAGGPPFTHVAAYEAGLVVTNALFHLRRTTDYEQVPWVTFTDPELARIGLTEEEAHERYGDDVIVSRFDHARVDRAVTTGRTDGFTKIVADPKGRIVGATIVSPAAGETIAEVAAFMAMGGEIDDLSQTVHAYPTFSLGTKHAADDHMREKWFNPKVRTLTKPLLRLLRLVER